MRSATSLAACALAPAFSTAVLVQGLPRAAKPEEVGLSSDKLKGYAVAFRDREEKAAMKPDAIFRIASMTKPMGWWC